MAKRVLVGYVGVDSGTIMIVDPCYVIPDKDWEKFCGQIPLDVDEAEGAPVCLPGEKRPTAVAGSTRDGDGVFPVFAKYGKDGQLEGYEISFVEE
jgi:hypothetical protein